MNEKPTVTVDSELRDLLPAFIERKRGDLKRILQLAGEGNFALVATTAHKLIGEGGSFGIDVITDTARKMERAANGREAALVISLANELLDYLDSVRIVYSTKDE